MNTKLEKTITEIEKLKTRLIAQQARLRDLERLKTELENAEIVALFRKELLTEDSVAGFIHAVQARDVPHDTGDTDDMDDADDADGIADSTVVSETAHRGSNGGNSPIGQEDMDNEA